MPSLPITLDQLQVFLSVAREGSFTGAARSLHRAQSAISYAVANLERLLGVTLFDRTGRTPDLTEAGRALLADAMSVQRTIDRLTSRALSIAEGVEVQLAIVVDAMFPLRVLVGGLRHIQQAYPQVPLRLYTAALGAAVTQVRDGHCSLGFCGPLHRYPDELQRTMITELELVSVCAPSHPLAQSTATLSECSLAEHTQIVLTDTTDFTAGVDQGVISPKTWRVADLTAKHAFLLAGFGWGNMPIHRVETELRSGELVRIRPAVFPEVLRVPLYAVWRSDAPPGMAGKELLSKIEELFSDDR